MDVPRFSPEEAIRILREVAARRQAELAHLEVEEEDVDEEE